MTAKKKTVLLEITTEVANNDIADYFDGRLIDLGGEGAFNCFVDQVFVMTIQPLKAPKREED